MDIVEPQTIDRDAGPCCPEQLCPECGATMAEKDRLAEGRALFVWYTCSRAGCDGQWLRRISKDV